MDIEELIAKLLEGDINDEEWQFLQNRMQENEALAGKVRDLQVLNRLAKYFENKLDPTEREAFEEEMEINRSLKEKFKAFQATQMVLEMDQQNRYKELVDHVIEQNPGNSPSMRWWRWGIIGTLGVTLAIAAVYLIPKQLLFENTRSTDKPRPTTGDTVRTLRNNNDATLEGEKKDSDLKQHENNSEGTTPSREKSSSKEEKSSYVVLVEPYVSRPFSFSDYGSLGLSLPDSIRNKWREAYSKEGYGEVIRILSTIDEQQLKTRENAPSYFALGLAYLYDEKYQEATAVFEGILNMDPRPYKWVNITKWYYALSLLCIRNREQEGIALIEAIVEGGSHSKKAEAQQLLQSITKH